MSRKLPLATVILGALLLAAGSYYGLAISPPEEHMGNVQRILYVHVPTAWSALLVLTFAFGCAIAFLVTGRWAWDHRLEASIEMAVVLCFLLSVQGAIWAKPTWGVWWDWDPRLTTVAVLLTAFLGIAALRHFVEDPMKRATWSAVATVIGYVDVPIVYFSVKWWNSLHQQQSTLSSVSREFLIPWFTNFAGLLLVIGAVIAVRARTAALQLEHEIAPPPVALEVVEEIA
ncbi:MAG TPA: cytochrome c biogenesis protein CcsA [Vicinamibacterales bacterium]|nr:cytochrome c biogenesis protein CcsA [Thermoanaerobaculia bacterium]HUK37028.1 cytochrome c biogenesis protein CcsA [Vicinamibacterales bacterium]